MRVALTLVAGSGLGTLVALLVAPSMIEWFATPAMPTVCSCVEQITWALDRLRASIAGIALGFGVLAIILVELVRHRRAERITEAS